MAGWKKQAVGDVPLYQATTMAWLPGIVQGFTTRSGGVSAAPYDTLNLGVHVGDSPSSVQANRDRLWSDLGIEATQVAFAEQVHGEGVARVTEGNLFPLLGQMRSSQTRRTSCCCCCTRTVCPCTLPTRWAAASDWYTPAGVGQRPTSSARRWPPCGRTLGHTRRAAWPPSARYRRGEL